MIAERVRSDLPRASGSPTSAPISGSASIAAGSATGDRPRGGRRLGCCGDPAVAVTAVTVRRSNQAVAIPVDATCREAHHAQTQPAAEVLSHRLPAGQGPGADQPGPLALVDRTVLGDDGEDRG